MGLQKIVEDLLEQALSERPTLFVTNLSISSTNHISIKLDGDQGVNLQDCVDISKIIDNSIEDETYNHSIEVASCGAESPIKNLRQLPKSIGRTVSIKLNDQEFDATLTDIKDNLLVLEWKTREPKKIGKGKETIAHHEEIPFEDIKEIKVKITFN